MKPFVMEKKNIWCGFRITCVGCGNIMGLKDFEYEVQKRKVVVFEIECSCKRMLKLIIKENE